MTVEEQVATVFDWNYRTWKVDGREGHRPTQRDIEQTLDQAVKTLYDSPVGTTLEVGGLVIIKRTDTLDVFVHVGEY